MVYVYKGKFNDLLVIGHIYEIVLYELLPEDKRHYEIRNKDGSKIGNKYDFIHIYKDKIIKYFIPLYLYRKEKINEILNEKM